jgi:hypothetical protein
MTAMAAILQGGRMKKTMMLLLGLGFLSALPAMDNAFAKGQLFISAYAGFVPAENSWDVMYNLCFESAVSQNVSIGFAYSQKQSHSGENQDRLVIPLQPDTTEAPDKLTYSNITTRLFCLEGKYHFAFVSLKRLDLFCGAGFGLELNKNNSLNFTFSGSELIINYLDKNHYYLVANFFGGAGYYLAENLALAVKAGYQYSGISGYDAVFSLGITFRIQ